MTLDQWELESWIDNEIACTISEGVAITAAMVEQACWVVVDNFRDEGHVVEYNFEIDDKFFRDFAEELNETKE